MPISKRRRALRWIGQYQKKVKAKSSETESRCWTVEDIEYIWDRPFAYIEE